MKIVNEKPPIWDDVCRMIGAVPQNAVFAWGDTIYNPYALKLPDYIIEHEKVHMRQHEAHGGPEAWWSRYLDDPYFRITQEVEAYARQYEVMSTYNKDRNVRFRMLTDVARSLSGPLYGNTITLSEAMKLIKEKAKV